MSYKYDEDLEFLSKCSDRDLDDLVSCLTLDKDGNRLLTENLTLSDSYKKHYPHHSKYWQEIAEEIQLFGGNTVFNILRGNKGVLYKEVLTDVCDKLKVDYNQSDNVYTIETNLLDTVFKEMTTKMSDKDRLKLVDTMVEMGIIDHKDKSLVNAKNLHALARSAFKAGGFKSYQLSVIVVNFVWKMIFGKGLSFAANHILTKVLSVWAGSVGFCISILWTALDVGGPAYRITIPAVFQIAMLRREILTRRNNNILLGLGGLAALVFAALFSNKSTTESNKKIIKK